ncbi:MAG: hypothetical protein H7174_01745 [Flavobacterium sp.]|nr:hypothetical protein [Flavobacterium sp.]
MTKKIILLAFLLASFKSISQEFVGSIPVTLKKDKEVFQVVNEFGKQVTMFFGDKKSVKAIKLSEKMQIIDSISSPRPNSDYSNIVGYFGDKSNPTTLRMMDNNKEMLAEKFDFATHKISTKQFALDFKGEKILKFFSTNNNFYLLSLLKNTSILKLYVFNENGKTDKSIDLTSFHFLNDEFKKTTFSDLMGKNIYNDRETYSLATIIADLPNTIATNCKKRKIYIDNKTIKITIDINSLYTQIIIIDLDTFLPSEKMIKKPEIILDSSENDGGIVADINSNSCLFDNKLYQIKSTSNYVKFSIKDLDDNLLFENTLYSEKPIEIKNSDILIETGKSSNRKIILSNKFIRKINNQSPSISCSKNDENVCVTIGSISEPQQQMSGGMMVGAMFGLAGVLLASALSSPASASFNAYANREVTYVNCLFDNSGKHLSGNSKTLTFDKMRRFLEDNPDISIPTTFMLGDALYLGFSYNDKNAYFIKKYPN